MIWLINYKLFLKSDFCFLAKTLNKKWQRRLIFPHSVFQSYLLQRISKRFYVFFDKFEKKLKNFKKKIETITKNLANLNQKLWKVFNKGQGKKRKILEKRQLYWKWFFAIISRTVRARAKILVEINPLGHIHTPPHLFLAKNVIIIEFCHGSKFWSFFNENN